MTTILDRYSRYVNDPSLNGAENVPLQIEHIVSKAHGGSDRVSNLTLACQPCNEKKGSMFVEKFLADKPSILMRILAQTKTPLKDAASVNATRWALKHALELTSLPIETASGGKTKWNRSRFGIPKTHALDALCVGNINTLVGWQMPSLSIKSTGRGAYQRTRLSTTGFPRCYLMRRKQVFGFQTGDLVRAIVPSGKHQGTWTGRVAVRTNGSFNIQIPNGVVQGISHKYCRMLMQADGYTYNIKGGGVFSTN